MTRCYPPGGHTWNSTGPDTSHQPQDSSSSFSFSVLKTEARGLWAGHSKANPYTHFGASSVFPEKTSNLQKVLPCWFEIRKNSRKPKVHIWSERHINTASWLLPGRDAHWPPLGSLAFSYQNSDKACWDSRKTRLPSAKQQTRAAAGREDIWAMQEMTLGHEGKE